MAMLFANAPRMFVLRARRETVLLLVAAVATTLALAHGHRRDGPKADGPKATSALSTTAADNRAADGWTGNLAVATASDPVPAEVLSSASLVVPKAQLALPAPPPRPVVRQKSACDSADKLCATRPGAAGLAPKRQMAALDARDRDQRDNGSIPLAASIDRDGKDRLVPPESIPAGSPGGRDVQAPAKKGFFASLNPLDHVPDLHTIGRPFAAAGDTVGGWIRRF